MGAGEARSEQSDRARDVDGGQWQTYVSKRRLRCRRPRTSVQSRSSARTVLTHRSAKALASGDRTGVRITLAPSVLNTSSQGTGELLIAVADEEAYECLRIVTVEGEVSRLLGHERAVRVRGRAGDVHPSGADLDEEQHVERLQEDGLHREEVAREDPRGLSAQELRPARAAPSGSGPEA